MGKENFINTQYGYCYYDLKDYFIYNLYIHKKYRHRGYAKRLIGYAINEIRQTGYIGDIGIQVKPRENSISKADLINFYERMELKIMEDK